jgi:hypothetical protein
MPTKPAPRKRGTLTQAIPSPDLPTQNNSSARTEQPNVPAQATSGNTTPPSRTKK